MAGVSRHPPRLWRDEPRRVRLAIMLLVVGGVWIVLASWFNWRGTWSLLGWAVCVTAVIVANVIIRRSVREDKRARAGQCRKCGYDLRATPARCPECGATPAPGRQE